jgi:hypothetical protein
VEAIVADRADYYVERVRYNKGHTLITQVSIRQDSGDRLTTAVDIDRRKMVVLLHQGKRFMTIHRNPEGKYRRGKILTLIQIKGKNYIQADPNQEKCDHLGDIPEY